MDNKVPPNLDSQIEKVANKMLRQYLRGQNCEKTNAIYRELIKKKMADISKCKDSLCPSSKYCYRFTATEGIYQSYDGFNREDDADNCDMFWSNGIDSNKCKLGGVKRDGEICNLDYCTYPKCVQDDYCEYCHKAEGEHKMSCPTRKIQINL